MLTLAILTGSSLVTLLAWLIIITVALWIIWKLLSMWPIPEPIRGAIMGLLGLACLIYLLKLAGIISL